MDGADSYVVKSGEIYRLTGPYGAGRPDHAYDGHACPADVAKRGGRGDSGTSAGVSAASAT